jgi:hypothetical protein
MQADWVEYQCIFDDLLKRWSAQLARDSRTEKDRIKRLEGPPQTQQPVPPVDTKTELRRRVANLRGFGLVESPPTTEEKTE